MTLAMSTSRPPPSQLLRAVEVYLTVAYGGPVPRAAEEQLSRLRATPDEACYESEVFERSDGRLSLRLGNRLYPHMKLVVEASETGLPHFRVDTHDRHFLDLVGAPDPGLSELMVRNEALARRIEDAWSAAGIPTVREHWRARLDEWHASRP